MTSVFFIIRFWKEALQIYHNIGLASTHADNTASHIHATNQPSKWPHNTIRSQNEAMSLNPTERIGAA